MAFGKINMDEVRRRLRNPFVREGERRASERRNCKWRATISAPPVEIGCVVEDISRYGCRVQVFFPQLAVGAVITVSLPSHRKTFTGQVVWRRGEEAGIRFL